MRLVPYLGEPYLVPEYVAIFLLSHFIRNVVPWRDYDLCEF